MPSYGEANNGNPDQNPDKHPGETSWNKSPKRTLYSTSPRFQMSGASIAVLSFKRRSEA